MNNRYKILFLFAATSLAIFSILRALLFIHAFDQLDLTLLDLCGIFAIGLLYDLIVMSCLLIPWIIYLMVLPARLYASRINHYVFYTGYIVLVLRPAVRWRC